MTVISYAVGESLSVLSVLVLVPILVEALVEAGSDTHPSKNAEIYANLVFKDLIKRRPGYLLSSPLFSLSSPRSHL